MGVSGSGKSTVGDFLSKKIRYPFFEGDDYHSNSSKHKMKDGIPLTDKDRQPWLLALSKLISDNPNIVLSCSALKESYRSILCSSNDLKFVYLKCEKKAIKSRLLTRKNHFFNPKLLDSQFDALEEPKNALEISAEYPVPQIVQQIITTFKIFD